MRGQRRKRRKKQSARERKKCSHRKVEISQPEPAQKSQFISSRLRLCLSRFAFMLLKLQYSSSHLVCQLPCSLLALDLARIFFVRFSQFFHTNCFLFQFSAGNFFISNIIIFISSCTFQCCPGRHVAMCGSGWWRTLYAANTMNGNKSHANFSNANADARRRWSDERSR